jgi:hypothetical protein
MRLSTPRRARPSLPAGPPDGRSGPVMLVTLECGFAPEAERIAVTSAVESGVPLLLVDLIDVSWQPASAIGGSRCARLHPEERAGFRRIAEHAASLGVPTTILHVRTMRLVRAMRELVAEQRPALLVFGPSRVTDDRRTRSLVAAVRAQTSCLVWIAE